MKLYLLKLVYCALGIGLWSATAFARTGGAGALGQFDASYQDVPNSTTSIYRAISVVDPSAYCTGYIWNCPANRRNPWLVSTNLSYSTNNGKTWTNLGTLNAGVDYTSGVSSLNEVPSLVYDPSDSSPGARYKVIWDHFMMINGVRDHSMAWIGAKGAAAINGPSSFGGEIKLIAGSLYNPNNTISPGNPIFPLPTWLSDCLVLTEPGTLSAADGFYASMTCHKGTSRRVHLMKFQHSGTTNTLVNSGPLLQDQDAASFAAHYGATYPELASAVHFDASSLVTKGGTTYLIATPVNSADQYMGCAVFIINDLTNGSISRNVDASPALYKYVPGTPSTHRGACALSPNTSPGLNLSQLVTTSSVPFTVVNTNVSVP